MVMMITMIIECNQWDVRGMPQVSPLLQAHGHTTWHECHHGGTMQPLPGECVLNAMVCMPPWRPACARPFMSVLCLCNTKRMVCKRADQGGVRAPTNPVVLHVPAKREKGPLTKHWTVPV
eukprot:744898-Pelagomonas_calceolata.AAC.6